MLPGTEGASSLGETGTPAGLGDGCQWSGLKWVVYGRILNGRRCVAGADGSHGSAQV